VSAVKAFIAVNYIVWCLCVFVVWMDTRYIADPCDSVAGNHAERF